MLKDHLYSTKIIWSGAKQGSTKSYATYSREFTIHSEGKTELVCSADKIFRGDGGLYNPEDLFLSTIASCHMLWYLHLCADSGIQVISYTDTPTANLHINEDGSGQFTEVTLHPLVEIQDKELMAKAQHLHEAAHEKCFIARSVNFPVKVHPQSPG